MSRNALFVPLALLAACSVDDTDPNTPGGQFGEEETSGCEVVDEVVLSVDEVSDLGFSPQDVLDLAEGAHSAALSWADGGSATLSLTVTDGGTYTYRSYQYVSTDGMEMAMDCPADLVIDVTLAVSTDDGVLAESFDGTLVAVDGLLVSSWVDLEGLSGTFDPEDYATETYDEVWADLSVSYEEAGVSGEIWGYGESSSGSGPDDVVSMTRFEIASF